MAGEYEAGGRGSADGRWGVLAECVPFSDRGGAGEYTGDLERGGSGWPVQRGGRESGVEHEVSLGHGGELQYDVWSEYAGVLSGARVEGDDARGTGVRVRGAAADSKDSGGAGVRRTSR